MVCPPFFLFFIFGVTLVHANLYMYILGSVSDFTLAAKVNLGKVKSNYPLWPITYKRTTHVLNTNAIRQQVSVADLTLHLIIVGELKRLK